jgi:hypothetical protein
MVDKRRKGIVKVPEGKVAWTTGRSLTIRDVSMASANTPLFVEVRSMKGGNPHDPYTIQLTAEIPETPHETEPNWRPSNATPLTQEQTIDGYIGHPTDWDVFRIDAQTPKVATVAVSGIPGVNVKIELIQEAKVVQTVNEMEAGAPETLAGIPLGPRPAFVRLSSSDHTFNVDKGYRIAVELADAGNREIEPNNDFAKGERTILPFDTPLKGHIHPRGDVDYFAIDVMGQTIDETRIITVKLTGTEGLQLTLRLFDSERALITKKGGVSAGQTRSITHGCTPGRYFVRVEEATSQAASGIATYTLEVTE